VNIQLLLAVAGVAAVAALMMGGVEQAEDEETKNLKEEARDYFRVVGDCEAVEFTGTATQAANFWQTTGRPYIEAKIEEALMAGVSARGSAMWVYILNDLVPNCTWPPEGTAVDNPSQHVLYAAIAEAVQSHLGTGDVADPVFESDVDPIPEDDEPQFKAASTQGAQAKFEDQ
jgi:hypothetical protein